MEPRIGLSSRGSLGLEQDMVTTRAPISSGKMDILTFNFPDDCCDQRPIWHSPFMSVCAQGRRNLVCRKSNRKEGRMHSADSIIPAPFAKMSKQECHCLHMPQERQLWGSLSLSQGFYASLVSIWRYLCQPWVQKGQELLRGRLSSGFEKLHNNNYKSTAAAVDTWTLAPAHAQRIFQAGGILNFCYPLAYITAPHFLAHKGSYEQGVKAAICQHSCLHGPFSGRAAPKSISKQSHFISTNRIYRCAESEEGPDAQLNSGQNVS